MAILYVTVYFRRFDTPTPHHYATHSLKTMRISLSKDPKSKAGDILVHVEVSAADDPPDLIYSHSFRYKVPEGTGSDGKNYGEIIVYTGKIAASGDIDGAAYPFPLEKCRNKECRQENCCSE